MASACALAATLPLSFVRISQGLSSTSTNQQKGVLSASVFAKRRTCSEAFEGNRSVLQMMPGFHKKAMLRNGQGVPHAAVTDSSATAAAGADTRALVESLLTKIANTDRGAAMTEEQKAEAARLIAQLENVGTKDPLKDPRIFGDWEVVYSSNPTSSGGNFRSTLGRTVLKTRDMVQAVKEPNVVGNQVAFNALGVIPGEVTLEGTLTTDDYIWADVSFKRPTFKLGPFSFAFGGDSSVRLATTYLDERIRLGKGSRGSSFVFKRK